MSKRNTIYVHWVYVFRQLRYYLRYNNELACFIVWYEYMNIIISEYFSSLT